MLAEQLYSKGENFAQAWNFGPPEHDVRNVGWIIEKLVANTPGALWQLDQNPQPHEANYLKLDSSKAHARLGWQPRWNLQTALEKTLEWHTGWRKGDDMHAVTLSQIADYQLARLNA